MKRITIARAFTVVCAAVAVSLAAPAHAQGRVCSNATLRGNFADKDTGVITAPPEAAGPFVGVHLQTYDGNGGLTSVGVVSLNGTVMPVTMKGSYTVNADCTGTYTVQVAPLGLTSHAFFVIDDAARELQIIVTDAGTAITCVARKVSGD